MKGLTFKTTGTWFYFDDSREFFKGDYIVATGPVYDTNHSTSNKHERLLDYLNLISKNVNIIKVENPGRKLCEMNINIIFVQAATVARYPAATRLVADCK